jgi:hypothetical protein
MHRPRGAGWDPVERVRRLRASCGATSATKETGPAAAVAEAVSRTAANMSTSRVRSTRTPRAYALSSPISSIRSPRALPEDHGQEDRAHAEQRPDLAPVTPVERAGHPHHRAGGVDEIGLGEQIAVDGGEHRGDTDTDQHQPVAVDALPPGQRVDRDPGQQTAADRSGGDGGRIALEEDDHGERPGRRALPEADHVRTAQRIAGDGLEDRSGQPEGRADQQPDQDARQPQVVDDEVLGHVPFPARVRSTSAGAMGKSPVPTRTTLIASATASSSSPTTAPRTSRRSERPPVRSVSPRVLGVVRLLAFTVGPSFGGVRGRGRRARR